MKSRLCMSLLVLGLAAFVVRADDFGKAIKTESAITDTNAAGATNVVAGVTTAAGALATDATNAAIKAESAIPANTNVVAVMKTSAGTMVLEFWPDVAPIAVANFIKLAKSGYYDGTAFHRVIPGFMIQGGDPYTKDASKEGMWGQGGPGYTIKAEFNDRSHQRGVLSQARLGGDVNSGGSQFFICLGDESQLDHQYTTFGKLIKGDDVLEKIGNTPTHPPDRPNTVQRIESVKIVPASSVK